uniref:Protein kinase domain-containing protein n=1 Tax=Davidia involucrata TaxID=16924 RepID=A0A5B6Z0I9_DAVIN
MGGKRSAINCLDLKIYAQVFVGFMLIYTVRVSRGYTNPGDVAAINNLYAALGYPPLPGWVPSGGDPCADAWQGVQCINTDINSIILNGANLGGQLGDNLGSFSSIKAIGLSNNHIGGSIPSSLPLTIQNVFLSDNQFTGSIPSSLSSLNQLSAMSLNNNQLTGEIPDAFQGLTVLVNLDLSSNNLSGQLPPSLENLSSLTTLRMQNNQLSGTLDVLQYLPLRDLNIENNLFSGPIPENLLSIPNFKKDGNPFNSTITPLPPPTSPTTTPPVPPLSGAPSSERTPGKQADGPSVTEESNSKRTRLTTKSIVGISIAGVFLFIILVLGLLLFMPRCCRGRQAADRFSKRHEIAPYIGSRENTTDNESLVQPSNQTEKVPKVAVVRPKEEHQTGPRRMGLIPVPRNEQELNVQRMSAIPKQDNHERDMSRFDIDSLRPPPTPPPPPPPPPPTLFEKVIVKPIVPAEITTVKPSTKSLNPSTTVKSYTIAALQQYTNSFSQENLIGGGMLGSVYRAQLPDGKLLAVKKLDKRASSQQKDDEFLDLVNSIDKIRHANVVELMGYCAEHGERLLIYEYCSNGTLQDALHSDDEFKKKLSWNIRIRMALGAARALEYLHEVCEPSIIHRNFKSVNVLLNDELAVHVSDCGLATLISSGSVSQLSGHLLSAYGYGAPEFESGVYTSKSDVYSFGVVMLELLTGRKSHDRTRNRGEQFLVRWAIPQLHDIDALSRMVDPSLNGEYPAKSLSHFADIISRCVQPEPEFRPPMSEVVQDLTQMIRKEPPNRSHTD